MILFGGQPAGSAGTRTRDLLIANPAPTSHQTNLSAIYSGAEDMLLSCPDVQLFRINDLSLLILFVSVYWYVNLLIPIYVLPVVSCLLHVCYMQNKGYLLTYLRHCARSRVRHSINRRLANWTVQCAGSAIYQIWFRLAIPNPNSNPKPSP